MDPCIPNTFNLKLRTYDSSLWSAGVKWQ